MAGRLSQGWSMAKASFAVLKQHPKLAVLPAVSGAVFLVVIGTILISLLPQLGEAHTATNPVWNWLGDGHSGSIWFYMGAFAVFFVLTATAIFFNVALVQCAMRAHAGDTPVIRDGLNAAVGLLPQILGWALITTTVGIVLNMITDALRNYLGFLGSLFGGLFEVSWAVITYFVVPVLAVEKIGPVAAVRRSTAILRSKWGESLAGEARIGLIGILFTMVAVAIFMGGLLIALTYGATGMAALGPILMTLGVTFGIVVTVTVMTLSTIFQSGVYIYATTGQVPATLDRDLVVDAFSAKR